MGDVPPSVLEWAPRSERLLREIARYAPDVLFLAECNHFDEFYVPELLAACGLVGHFQPKVCIVRARDVLDSRVTRIQLIYSVGVEMDDPRAGRSVAQSAEQVQATRSSLKLMSNYNVWVLLFGFASVRRVWRR